MIPLPDAHVGDGMVAAHLVLWPHCSVHLSEAPQCKSATSGGRAREGVFTPAIFCVIKLHLIDLLANDLCRGALPLVVGLIWLDNFFSIVQGFD